MFPSGYQQAQEWKKRYGYGPTQPTGQAASQEWMKRQPKPVQPSPLMGPPPPPAGQLPRPYPNFGRAGQRVQPQPAQAVQPMRFPYANTLDQLVNPLGAMVNPLGNTINNQIQSQGQPVVTRNEIPSSAYSAVTGQDRAAAWLKTHPAPKSWADLTPAEWAERGNWINKMAGDSFFSSLWAKAPTYSTVPSLPGAPAGPAYDGGGGGGGGGYSPQQQYAPNWYSKLIQWGVNNR